MSGKKKVEYSLPGTAHSTARVARVFFMLCLCVISVCAHTVDRRVSLRDSYPVTERFHRRIVYHIRRAHASDARGIPLPCGPAMACCGVLSVRTAPAAHLDLRNAGAPTRRALKSCEVSIIV